MPVVLPYVPETITVHLGLPDQWAENVTVYFPDYVKNVASSEIYPTWEPAAIRANILAIISFAVNRVYTEFYRSRGYDFQITSTTAYDQKFIRGRNIFENISLVVDDIFNCYIRRRGTIEPLAAKFCNGTTSTCQGMSQWGSQELAQRGYDSMQILRFYYGDDIELVVDAPVQGIRESYPGTPLRRGSVGPHVAVLQVMLNRISQNYPAIPRVSQVLGVFDDVTEQAVLEFQRIFQLERDGIVGKATWYQLVYLYVGVTRLSELASQGQTYYSVQFDYPGILRQGDQGSGVQVLQHMLQLLAQFNDGLPQISVDGKFGPATARAVRAYQSSAGLAVDGIVGPETWWSVQDRYMSAMEYLRSRGIRISSSEEVADLPPEILSETAIIKTEQMAGAQYPGFLLQQGSQDGQQEVSG